MNNKKQLQIQNTNDADKTMPSANLKSFVAENVSAKLDGLDCKRF